MRILGIDPGSLITGFGLIDQKQFKSAYVASGCIRVTKHTLANRLKYIFDGISEIILQYQPTHIAIEQVFVHKNVSSALKLGQARGVAMVACANLGFEVSEYSARAVKKAVLGYGAADKAQVQYMIQTLLNLNAKPSSDAADALAIAMCHGLSNKGIFNDRKTYGPCRI
ncbi:MAG: crossover junction endodeoxyribonuclease RuvC [Francisellaceae bacterium]|nr:crossover junction endodeoxyribonuclease RuvC [Francisellaceae bacterium]